MSNCEDKVLKELTEMCENVMFKRQDRLPESLTNAGENGKMSYEDTSEKGLINTVNKNVINNSAFRILENRMNAIENLTIKCDDVFGETLPKASYRSTRLMDLGHVGNSKTTSGVGGNYTNDGENGINLRDCYAEDLTNASKENNEMNTCSKVAVGNVSTDSKDALVESFTDTDIRGNINDGPTFGEDMTGTDQNVIYAHADANVLNNKDEIVEDLTNTVANIIVSNIESDGTKEGTSFSSENNESFEYQENSEYSFSQLEERKKPTEIKTPGKKVLSNTENGESSILYEPNFYTEDEAWELFDFLIDSTNWLDKNIVIHGVEYPQPRLVAWYGPLPYSYSGTTLEPGEMPDCVLAIKRRVEDYLKGNNINVELNSVLLNLYRNNKDSVSWHSDDEFTMGVCPTIASVSLGETRRFEMRQKSNRYNENEHEKKGDEYFVHLNNGSLIIMDGCMQEDWQHRVPKEYHDRNPRINLTFRTVYEFEKGSPYSCSRVNNFKPVNGEIPKNPSKIKIVDLDEENFPPLSSVSNNVNSKIAPKINYPNYKSLSEINDEINNAEEEWIVETPPSNKTNSKINDKINASEEEWIVKTPVSRKALFETNDTVSTSQEEIDTNSLTRIEEKINASEEEWIVKSPVRSKTLTKRSLSNNTDYPEEGNQVHRIENTVVEHRFPNRAPPVISNIIDGSEEEWTITSPVKNYSSSEFSEINKSNYNSYEKSAYNSQLTPPESNNKLHRDWYDEPCNNQISLESDKINRFDKDCLEKNHHRQIPLKSSITNKSPENKYVKSYYTKPNRFQSNKTNIYHEARSAKPSNNRNAPLETGRYHRYNDRGTTEPFYTKNVSRQEKNLKFDDIKSSESQNIARNTYSNNEKKYVKREFSIENKDDYEQRFDKNQNSNFKERGNDSSHFAVHSIRRHFSDIRNEPGSNRSNGWKPNVKAEEFIPGKMKNIPSKMDMHPSSVNSSTFDHFHLSNLLNYDVELMPRDELKNYANALKSRVLEKISKFKPSDQEELEVLTEITDGNQTDRNQKIICSRICALVKKTVPKKQWKPIMNSPIPRYHEQTNHENDYLDSLE